MSGEATFQSIDMTSLKSSIDRYDKLRRRLKNKQNNLHQQSIKEPVRPNTMHLHRRHFQINSEMASSSRYHSPAIKTTNEDTPNIFPASIEP